MSNLRGSGPNDPAPGPSKRRSLSARAGRKPAPRSAFTRRLPRLSCWHSAGDVHPCQGIGFPSRLALSMALTHHSLLQEPARLFLHLPREGFLKQSHFPDPFHVLSEGLSPRSQQPRHFGMIRRPETLGSGLRLRCPAGSCQHGFGSCCRPIQPTW